MPEPIRQLKGDDRVAPFVAKRGQPLCRVNGQRPYLDLFVRAGRQQLAAFNPCVEASVENEHPVQLEDVRDEVVREDGQSFEIVEAGLDWEVSYSGKR